MPAQSEMMVIAVWIERKGRAPFFAGVPEQPNVYHLRCASADQTVGFRFKTGNLIAEANRQCELLQQHGFTVLRVPRQHAAFANSEVNNQIILVQAAMRHLVEVYNQRSATVTEYSEAFGREVLAVIAGKHPARVQMIDIKEALTPEPTDQELLTALDALSIDGYIEGKGMRESSSGKVRLAIMANIISTKAGRELLKPASVLLEGGAISNLHFHGPVGAVGHQSTGSVSINQQWITSAPEPDWPALVVAFKDAAAVKASNATSSNDWMEVAALAKAHEQATQKDKGGFLDTVSKIGQSTLPILASAGAHGLVNYLGQHFKWNVG